MPCTDRLYLAAIHFSRLPAQTYPCTWILLLLLRLPLSITHETHTTEPMRQLFISASLPMLPAATWKIPQATIVLPSLPLALPLHELELGRADTLGPVL